MLLDSTVTPLIFRESKLSVVKASGSIARIHQHTGFRTLDSWKHQLGSANMNWTMICFKVLGKPFRLNFFYKNLLYYFLAEILFKLLFVSGSLYQITDQ